MKFVLQSEGQNFPYNYMNEIDGIITWLKYHYVPVLEPCRHAIFEEIRYVLCHEQFLQWVSMLLLVQLSTLSEHERIYENQGSKPTNTSLTQNFNLLQIMPNPKTLPICSRTEHGLGGPWPQTLNHHRTYPKSYNLIPSILW